MMLFATSHAIQAAIALCGLLVVFVDAQASGSLTINTPPSLISCQPASLTWSGASPPVYVSVLKGGDLSSEPLRQFPAQNSASGSFPWKVDLGSGNAVTLQVRDATGQTQASAPVNILSGPDKQECTEANSTTSAGGAAGGSSSAAAPPSSSTGAGAGSKNQTAATPPSTGTSSTASTPTNTSTSSPPSTGTTASTGSTSKTTSKNSAMSSYEPSSFGLALCLWAGMLLLSNTL